MNTDLIKLINNILASDLPPLTKDKIVKHYMLPQLGYVKAPLEMEHVDVGTVERPDKEEIDIESNPKLKAEYKDTERVMTGVDDDE
jgi:hypothetical protein